jgi:hypothetical protein
MSDVHAVPDPDPRQRAIQLIDGGRFREAVDLLLPLSSSRPDDATLWRVLGVAQGSAGDVDQAILSLRHSVALIPTSARSHYHLAVVLAQRGDIGEARRHVERALALDAQMTSARDLAAQLATKRPAMRLTGASMPTAPRRATTADIRRALQSHRIPTGAAATSAAGYAPRAAGAVATDPVTSDPVASASVARSGAAPATLTGDSRPLGEQLASVLHSWSWDGFVCGMTVPLLWVGSHCGWGWGLGLLFGEGAGWVYVRLHPSVRLTTAAILFRICVALLLGIRGNALSWFGRPWRTVAEFRVCHRIWLHWGLGVMAASVVAASLAVLVRYIATPAARPHHVAAHHKTHAAAHTRRR